MEERSLDPGPAATPAHTPAPAPALSWLREGLRASLLRAPRTASATPTPLQLLALLLLPSLLMLGLQRLQVPGAAHFEPRTWLMGWWSMPALVFLAWALLGSRSVAAWLALMTIALVPPELLSQALLIAWAHELLPPFPESQAWLSWTIYVALWLWVLAVVARLARHFGVGPVRQAALALSLVGLSLLSQWLLPDRAWFPDRSAAREDEPPSLQLSQERFEQQQALWSRTLAEIAPQRPGVADVYGLVFAPYAGEEVFLRESTMVAQLLRSRFDAEGRVLHLVNHGGTAATHPWATPLNLQRAIAALGARMDRENDVLVVYLTSHGASNFELSASHWPLDVDALTPAVLRAALDEAGIRHRVLAISACFSGGWIAPLESEGALVMTAADATHTSYGCGRKSELTFFGRAVFDEQLRKTHSFEDAFAAAVPVIHQREVEAGKDDGPSNPQISVGSAIRPVLQALQQRLAAR